MHIGSRSPTTSAAGYPEDRSRTTWLSSSWHLCCVSNNCWRRHWISSPSTLASWRNTSILSTSKEARWPSMSCSFPTNPARSPDGTPPITVQAVARHLGTSVERGKVASLGRIRPTGCDWVEVAPEKGHQHRVSVRPWGCHWRERR